MQPDIVSQPSDLAFAALYQQYAPEIFTYLRMHTSTSEDAEDLLVEVFLAALEQPSFQTVPTEKQRAWLWRVARNKTIDLYRKTRQRPATRLEEMADALYFAEELEPEQYAMRTESRNILARHIQQLPTEQRQVIYLRFVHGLHSENIARLMNKRAGTVRMLLYRAINVLRAKPVYSRG